MTSRIPYCASRYWRVEPGDTFYLIAESIGATVAEITMLNPEIDPNNLEVGSLICVPLQAGIPTGRIPPCDSGFYWVIARGDTIFGIAEALGISTETLISLNGWADPRNLLPGDSLCLPSPL